MEFYCTKCGAKLKDNASFCSECGTPVRNADNENDRTMKEFDNLAKDLAKFSLHIAKGFAFLLAAGAAAACTIAAAGLVAVSFYMFYQFFVGGEAIFPWLFTGSLSGLPTLLGGVMSVFIAILFVVAAISLIRCVKSVGKKDAKSAEAA